MFLSRRRALATCCLCPLLATLSAVAGDLDEVRARGRLRVAVWKDNLPELFDPRAGGAGIEKEFLDGFAALQRLQLEVLPTDAIDDRVQAVLDGRADVVAGGVVATAARRKLLDFTGEVFPIRHVVVTRGATPPVASLEELRRLRLGTVKGSSWAGEIERAGVPAAQVDSRFATADEMLEGLRQGRFQAVVMTTVWAVVAQRRDPELKLGLQIGEHQGLGFGLRHDQPQLRAALDDYLSKLRLTPTWGRLVVKYFGPSGLEILRRSRD